VRKFYEILGEVHLIYRFLILTTPSSFIVYSLDMKVFYKNMHASFSGQAWFNKPYNSYNIYGYFSISDASFIQLPIL